MNDQKSRRTYPCPPTARGGCGSEGAIYVLDFHTVHGFGRVYAYACANCGRIRVPHKSVMVSLPDEDGIRWMDAQLVKEAIKYSKLSQTGRRNWLDTEIKAGRFPKFYEF